MPEVLADAQAQAHAQARVDGTQLRARAKEAALVEQSVVGQVRLAVDVADRALLEQCRRDVELLVVGALDEAHDRRNAICIAREGDQALVVGAHGDLGIEILEQVARQPQLGKDKQVDALGARIGERRAVLVEIRIERAEARRDLREAYPE